MIMKRLFLLVLGFTYLNTYSQTLPVSEDFNSQPSTWTFINGAGYMSLEGGNFVATTNIGTTPYPNNATVTITSPVYSVSNCLGIMSVSFYLEGRIELNYDFMYFEYSTNGGVSYTILQTFTGIQNNVFTYTVLNNANRFRFRLVTDGSVNTYCTNSHWLFGCLSTAVYYYDIDNFSITCDAYLPIQLKEFIGWHNTVNHLSWTTSSERDNDHFTLEHSSDGVVWEEIGYVQGAGNSSTEISYSFEHKNYNSGHNYYRLSQTDFSGTTEVFTENIVLINNVSNKKIDKIFNLLGQEVKEDAPGVKIILYNDGTYKKVYGK